MAPWYTQKTTWTAIIGLLAAIVGYFFKEIDLPTLIAAVLAAAGTIFMRQAVTVPAAAAVEKSDALEKVVRVLAEHIETTGTKAVQVAAKEAIAKEVERLGVKEPLDKVLDIMGILKKSVPLLLVALLFTGCGLLSSGTSGAAGEVGAATATNNIYLYVGFDRVTVDEDGNITATSTKDGESASAPAGGIIVNLGREAVCASTSSGGENAGANQAGGSGDVSPSFPTLGVGSETTPTSIDPYLKPVE